VTVLVSRVSFPLVPLRGYRGCGVQPRLGALDVFVPPLVILRARTRQRRVYSGVGFLCPRARTLERLIITFGVFFPPDSLFFLLPERTLDSFPTTCRAASALAASLDDWSNWCVYGPDHLFPAACPHGCPGFDAGQSAAAICCLHFAAAVPFVRRWGTKLPFCGFFFFFFFFFFFCGLWVVFCFWLLFFVFFFLVFFFFW